MKKIIYIDAFSGISGDMLIAAFLNAGMPVAILEENFRKLSLPEHYSLEYDLVNKGVLQGGSFKIKFDIDHSNGSSHQHRHMSDIRTIINDSGLNINVKDKALKIFEVLAVAEGKVHGQSPEDVHFHEVGATDSILDIIGVAVALDYFSIEELYCSSLPWSEGKVNTQHGVMPLPAPATLELLTTSKAVFRPFECAYELITPTGAAILAAFAKFEKPLMKIQHSGIGAGSKDFDWPNILRIVIGEKIHDQTNEYVVIETNIDDMNPQLLGNLMDKCFSAGAVDVFFESIYMKKNRPANKVSIIVGKSLESDIAMLLLHETTTYGVRVYPVWRYEAERDVIKVKCKWGEVRVKRKWMEGKVIQFSPEYEDCKEIAKENDLPLLQVIDEIKQLCHSDYP